MQHQGTIRLETERLILRGRILDEVIYAILESEYRARKNT